MICPFTLNNPADVDENCRNDCALRVIVKRKGAIIGEECAFAAMATSNTDKICISGVLVETYERNQR